MNVLIIEDEDAASKRLKKMLLQIDSSIKNITEMASVTSAVAYLKEFPSPDLIFADIQLGDGVSFEIFKEAPVSAPVIFTTAYDQYAIKAFKFNSIDYLLKPIKMNELEDSLSKYRKVTLPKDSQNVNFQELMDTLNLSKETYQKRLVIRYGQNIKVIEIAEVAYFYTEDKVAFACTEKNNKWPLDHTMDELEKLLDPSRFFRINRQFIISISSIESMHSYSKSRVKIILKPPCDTETIVSVERSASFKEWLQGK